MPSEWEIHKMKNVRFNNKLETVRYFDKESCPQLISGKVPLSINVLNLSKLSGEKIVQLEKIELNKSKLHLEGLVRVQNLAFHKQILLRITYDNWATFSELTTNYKLTLSTCNQDQFSFEIPIPNEQIKTIEHNRYHMIQFAIKYQVQDQIYWDNNTNQNYKVEIRPSITVDPEYFRKPKGLKNRYNFSTSIQGEFGKQVQLQNVFKPLKWAIMEHHSPVHSFSDIFQQEKKYTSWYDNIPSDISALGTSPPIKIN